MWLTEFHKLVPEAAKRARAPELDYGSVEQAFEPARRRMQVGPDELRILEEKTRWAYGLWWPPLSGAMKSPISLPEELEDERAKKAAVGLLYDRLKHIEVVSVVLRFLCPEQFGIISPPVVSLLNLVPILGEDHVDHYMRYLVVLDKLRTHYGAFARLADVDMALWSAAVLWLEKSHLADKMKMDKYFQEIRLENLLESLKWLWQSNDSQRLVLARVLVERDYLSVAALAVRVFESSLWEVARKLGISKADLNPARDQSYTGALAVKLDASPEFREKYRSKPNRKQAWAWRNAAVHPDRPISEPDAKSFVADAIEFWEATNRLRLT